MSPAASEYQRTVQPSAAAAVSVACSGPQFSLLANVGAAGLAFTVKANGVRTEAQPVVRSYCSA